MILAKVIGPVIATVKNSSLKARSIFVVQPVDNQKKPQGKTFLALDSVQARPGDIVFITREGNSCRQILQDELAPVNALITGIVDMVDCQIDIGEKRRSSGAEVKRSPFKGEPKLSTKRKTTFSFPLLLCLFFISIPAFSQTPISYNELKNRVDRELRNFTEITGMASQFKPLSAASPLGLWGGNFGVELTSIPQEGFRILGQPIETPLFFPRLHLAKGLTPNLDLELSALISKVIETAVTLPDEAKNLQIYGGGLKYSLLTEEENFPFSLAARATYTFTRFNLDFFQSNTYGADLSVSRSLSLSVLPLSFTPYAGMGYIVINGMFRKDLLDLTKANDSYGVQDYRYFTGMSVRLFLLNVTGEADFGNPKTANTYSLKVGLNIF